MKGNILIHALRLEPKHDLKKGLQEYATLNNIKAGWIMSCAGSLETYHLRFANRDKGNNKIGFFEIISLSGTLSVSGVHLHMSVSDSQGMLMGGHLLEDCIIFTTAEVIIGESPDIVFTREYDSTTSWKELQITQK